MDRRDYGLFFLVRGYSGFGRERRAPTFEREAKDAIASLKDVFAPMAMFCTRYGRCTLAKARSTGFDFTVISNLLNLEHRYPGFHFAELRRLCSAQEKKRFEGRVRRDTSLNPRGYPEFAIKPPGERPEYYAIVYLEPMVDYEFALALTSARIQQPQIRKG